MLSLACAIGCKTGGDGPEETSCISARAWESLTPDFVTLVTPGFVIFAKRPMGAWGMSFAVFVLFAPLFALGAALLGSCTAATLLGFSFVCRSASQS